jgi:hypothetical protein
MHVSVSVQASSSYVCLSQVDNLLTDFTEELGVKPEQFYEVMATEQGKDKLSAFVVQTILTVDDFLMFKVHSWPCSVHLPYTSAWQPIAPGKHLVLAFMAVLLALDLVCVFRQ